MKYFKSKKKVPGIINYKTTAFIIAVLLYLSIPAGEAFAQSSGSTKTAFEAIDPASIDLNQPTLFIVPYTHLDDMWRWSYPQVIRDFFKNTLDDNFAAFEAYPNYIFNWSGASPYQMTREYSPERYKELNDWVEAGRWYPGGSSWVENDVNVPCAEAVICQILMGTQYFKKDLGKETREFMLPDCFDHPKYSDKK